MHVLRHLRRFLAVLRVVFGFDVVPRQLAEAHQPEPGAEQREVVQGVRLVLEGRDLVVDHVHEDQPRLVVLRPLVGERVAALLRERFLGHVFGVLECLSPPCRCRA